MKPFLWLSTVALLECLAVTSSSAGLAPKRSVLDNGLVLVTSERRALPMVAIELLIAAGSRYDPRDREGAANLVARLLTYGTRERSALQINETLDFIGASLSTSCAEDLVTVSLTILKKDLDTGLKLLSEILTESVFPPEEVDRQKQSVAALIRAKEENPGDVAQRKFQETLYPDSRLGKPVEGTEVSLRAIGRDDLLDFFHRYYRPNRTIVAVVGDISHAEMERAVAAAFRSWREGEPPAGPLTPAVPEAARTVRVDKELTQANIILGHEGIGRENPDYYAVQVMNYILGGGGFSSRAVEAIRNQRGLAYSVYSYFGAEKGRGTFEFVMQTRNETAREAIRLAREEIRRIREQPVGEEELSDAKQYLIGSFPLRLDTNRRMASFLAQVEYFGLGLDYPERYPEYIRRVSREDVLRVAQKYLHPDKLITVIVGDAKKIGDSG
ncbi:MAG TPA: pitrilysin family protein [candidate division Zixibacteria bacterium]|nr:pitrilysin family protein [candidate division Zixibacteria bacterium]